jgi:hypothetical protein
MYASQFRWVIIPLVVVTCFCGLEQDVHAQEVGRLDNITASGVPYYVYTGVGQPTIQVYLVGGGSSGIYEVQSDLRLDKLLSLASLDPTSSPRARQEITVRLYRTDEESGARRLLLESDIRDLLEMNPREYPALQDGDFVNVEIKTRQRFDWRDGLRIVTSISSLIVLGERISRVF